jgi:YVTN family beta-propeller protein
VAVTAAAIPAITGVLGNTSAAPPRRPTAYVANVGTDTVTPIAMATNTPGEPIKVGKEPFAIAITPDGKTANVVNTSSTVTPIATATNTPGKPVKVGKVPNGIAFTPDGKTVYVANINSNTVTPIATATNTAGKPINVGTEPGRSRSRWTARPPTSSATSRTP